MAKTGLYPPQFQFEGTWITPFDERGEIGALAVNPANPDTVYAGVMGHSFLAVSHDGGTSWSEIMMEKAFPPPAVHSVAVSPNGKKVYVGMLGWGFFAPLRKRSFRRGQKRSVGSNCLAPLMTLTGIA